MKGDPNNTSYTNLSLAVLSAGLALLLLILRKRKKGKKTAFDSLPGPRQYFLGSYLNLLELVDTQKIREAITNCCAKFGPVTKIGLGPMVAVTLTSPHHIQKLLGSNHVAHLEKPHFVTKVFRPVSWAEGIMNSNGERWKSRRKLINSSFKLLSLQSFVPEFNESGRRLVARMQSLFEKSHSDHSAAAAAAPIRSALIDNSLTTTCRTILGIDFDTTKYTCTEEFVAGAKRFMEIINARTYQPWLGFDPLFNLTSASRELRQFYQLSSKFFLQLAEDQQQQLQLQEGGGNNNKNKSLLRDLIQAGLSNEGIYEETLTMTIAGFETTAAALETLLFFLSLYPQIQEKCQREVDQVFQQVDNNNRGIITLNDLNNLEYLEQCLLESIRLIPILPLLVRKLGAPLRLDDELELPSGTIVLVPLAPIHMNPEVYPEPEKFDPDRMGAERRKERSPYSYLAFSAGPRNCVGSKFAKIQILIVMAHILKHFTVRTSDKLAEVVWLHRVTLSPETPINFMFDKRE